MRFFAAIQSGNHPPLSATNGLDKARERVIALGKAVDAAWRRIQQLSADVQDSYQAVFVAPEFYFVNNQSAHAQDRYLSHDEKRWTIAQLSALAKTYPRLLIIPGTVLWTKDVTDSNRDKVKDRIMAAHNQHQKALPALIKKHEKEYGDAVEPIVNMQTFNPGYSFTGSATVPQGSYAPFHYLDNVSNTVIAQNVAYVCKADKILKYAKVGNSSELGGNTSNAVFAPGALAGVFSVGNVRYGLEICMDHWVGVLRHGTSWSPHIHIITSSYTENRTFHFTVVENGLILHSSTEARITPYRLNGLPDKPPKEENLGNSLQLFMFDLAIPVTGKANDELHSEGATGDFEGPLPAVKHIHTF